MKYDINIIKEFIISYRPEMNYIYNMQLTYETFGDNMFFYDEKKNVCIMEIDYKNPGVFIYYDPLNTLTVFYYVTYTEFESYIRNYKLCKIK